MLLEAFLLHPLLPGPPLHPKYEHISQRFRCSIQEYGIEFSSNLCRKVTVTVARELQERLPSIKCFGMKALV